MTISHRLVEDELAQASVEDLFTALGSEDTPRLFAAPYKIDVEHSVPNGGGSSVDRKTVYVDKILYEECMDGAFASSGLLPQQIIDRWCDHEHSEFCIIAGDGPIDTYYPAHERALRLEHEGVLAILGKRGAEGKIKKYEEAIWPALLRCYNRDIKNPPKDLWCGPNLDDPTERDEEILRVLAKLGVEDANKRSKYETHYGFAKHHCRDCRFWDTKSLSQEHGQLASCEAVSGVVRQNRGCSLFHPKTRG